MNINRIETDHRVIAYIHPATEMPDAVPAPLLVRPGSNGLQIASPYWRSGSRAARLQLTREVIGLASQFEGESLLRWTFSSATIACGQALGIAERWDESGEPPVFALPSLEFDLESVRTIGLKEFAGVEVEVCNVRSRIRGAMNLIARLARHILLSGPSIDARTVSVGSLKADLPSLGVQSAIQRKLLQVTLRD